MKKIAVYSFLVMGVLAFCIEDSYAFFGLGKKKEEEPKKVVEEKQAAKTEVKKEGTKKTPAATTEAVKTVDPKKLEQDRLIRQKKREQLDNSMWDIEITVMSGKEKPKKDVLVFESNRFYSEKYLKEGFKPTNYTLTIQEDGVTIWETMQTSDSGKVIFWRGEVEPKMTSMRGVASLHISETKTEDYSFVSQERKGIKKSEEKKEEKKAEEKKEEKRR